MQFLLNRLSEPSSWRGLTFVLTSVGVVLSPELMEQIVVAGTAMAGLIGFLTADH